LPLRRRCKLPRSGVDWRRQRGIPPRCTLRVDRVDSGGGLVVRSEPEAAPSPRITCGPRRAGPSQCGLKRPCGPLFGAADTSEHLRLVETALAVGDRGSISTRTLSMTHHRLGPAVAVPLSKSAMRASLSRPTDSPQSSRKRARLRAEKNRNAADKNRHPQSLRRFSQAIRLAPARRGGPRQLCWPGGDGRKSVSR